MKKFQNLKLLNIVVIITNIASKVYIKKKKKKKKTSQFLHKFLRRIYIGWYFYLSKKSHTKF
jgi:Ni,Fe-hydrogenase I cytochrome b subunit